MSLVSGLLFRSNTWRQKLFHISSIKLLFVIKSTRQINQHWNEPPVGHLIRQQKSLPLIYFVLFECCSCLNSSYVTEVVWRKSSGVRASGWRCETKLHSLMSSLFFLTEEQEEHQTPLHQRVETTFLTFYWLIVQVNRWFCLIVPLINRWFVWSVKTLIDHRWAGLKHRWSHLRTWSRQLFVGEIDQFW